MEMSTFLELAHKMYPDIHIEVAYSANAPGYNLYLYADDVRVCVYIKPGLSPAELGKCLHEAVDALNVQMSGLGRFLRGKGGV